jgi:hypothetical protein
VAEGAPLWPQTAYAAAAIRRALEGRRPRSILEVGAGYGRSAYVLMNVFLEARYTVVDIQPALTIAPWYLTQLFPSERLRFLRPEETSLLAGHDADVVVSISSVARNDARAGGRISVAIRSRRARRSHLSQAVGPLDEPAGRNNHGVPQLSDSAD